MSSYKRAQKLKNLAKMAWLRLQMHCYLTFAYLTVGYITFVSRADPPYTQNTHPCSQRCFNFSFVFEFVQRLLKTWMIISFLSPSLRKHQSNDVTWMSYSLLLETKESSWKRTEPQKRYCFSSAFRERDSRRSETRTNALVTSILSPQPPAPPPPPPCWWQRFA